MLSANSGPVLLVRIFKPIKYKELAHDLVARMQHNLNPDTDLNDSRTGALKCILLLSTLLVTKRTTEIQIHMIDQQSNQV